MQIATRKQGTIYSRSNAVFDMSAVNWMITQVSQVEWPYGYGLNRPWEPLELFRCSLGREPPIDIWVAKI